MQVHALQPRADRHHDVCAATFPAGLLEAGALARADDRGDSVLQLAPPLVSDRAVLDDIVDRVHDVLADAGAWLATRRSGREPATA